MPAKPNLYYLFIDGETKGPCTLADLHEMWQAERVTLNTLYVQPGPWRSRPLSQILDKVIGYQKSAVVEPAQPVDEATPGLSMLTYCVSAVSIVLLFCLIGAASKPSPEPLGSLKADIGLTMTRLSVFNGNNYDWRERIILLNGRPPQGYKREIRFLKAGASTVIPLTDFVGQRGARFDPWRMTVEEIWIGDDKQGYRSSKPTVDVVRAVPPQFPPPIR